jgi:uncharacterized protein (TIGR00255 family)
MTIHSMTGFAQVKGQANGGLGFTLSLKSVNHRFLDLHFRMPPDSDALEMKLRRLLKEKLGRGHIEVSVSLDRGEQGGLAVNRPFIAGYVETFRGVARDLGIAAEPDLNAVLRMPGAMDSSTSTASEDIHSAVLAKVEEVLDRLEEMRSGEGRDIAKELRDRMTRLEKATAEIEKLRSAMLQAHFERLKSRIQELVAAHAEEARIIQEAAVLAERSDIQEETVRLSSHVQQFLALLKTGGEVGKKLDFLLQEMNREANTLLSKTTGVAGQALRITEQGLAMKAEIEKSREQVQNLE